MLLQKCTDLKLSFPILPSNVYLVFPERFLVFLHIRSISRLQIPITLAFTQTDYKVQGVNFTSATIDLKRSSKFFDSTYKQFCSTYIQSSYLYGFAGLKLLQAIKIINIANQPYPSLAFKDTRPEKLSDQIIKN